MKILGIYNGHTASAALLEDGKIISAVSEERFTAVKSQHGFPRQSIQSVLDANNITINDIDYIAIPQLRTVPIYSPKEVTKRNLSIILLNLITKPVNYFRRQVGQLSYYWRFLIPVRVLVFNVISAVIGEYSARQEVKMIAKELKFDKKKILSYDHHLSHAASGYYSSPFSNERALVLTIDGEGDGLCASVNIFDGKSYATLSQTTRNNSIGHVYMYVTGYLGMKMVEHEYKVMGLAPYAKQAHVDKLYNKIKGLVTLDPKDRLKFKTKFHVSQMPHYLEKEMKGQRFDNIAGAFQKLIEERVEEWVQEAINYTGIKTVCLSGGVFMNVKLNKKIMEMNDVEKLFVLPSCGDESAIFGAAQLAFIDKAKDVELSPLTTMQLGPEFTPDQIMEFIGENKLNAKYKVTYHEEIEKEIAKLLARNKVVARMAGKGTFGARALGNRSILANPSDRDVVMIINEQMKDRDFWMPFAASILQEREHDYIINPKEVYAGYMIMAFDSTKLAQKELFAGIHPYDFTCRPQIVSKEVHPKYHKIISEFEALTGIGGVLNTSFNLHGLPIVLGPKEALYAFEHSGLEYMVLENYLISKNVNG